MLLVLADPHDRLARRLLACTTGRVEAVWLTPGDLVRGRWEHRVGRARTGADSPVEVRSRVHCRGRWHDLTQVCGTLNRVRWLPPASAGFASEDDREYAAAELHALLLSVLAALPGVVVNRPVPPSLSGADLTPAGWLALAASVGLPGRRSVLTTDARRHPRPGWSARRWPGLDALPPAIPPGPRPVVWLEPVGTVHRCWVVGDAVVPADEAAARLAAEVDVVRLARAGGCSLLEVGLALDDGGRVVLVGADAVPDDVPDHVLDALVHALLRGAAVPR